MSEHTMKNPFDSSAQDTDYIQNVSCDELKNILLRHGMWPQYTKRIKNLEKVEQEFWKLYGQEIDIIKKSKILEDIGNLQTVVSNCYATARDIIIPPKKGELNN